MVKMRVGKLGFLAITACAVVTPAFGQEARKLDFGVRASVVHDSNFARTNPQQAALRGIKSEEVIFTPSATFDLIVPVSRQTFYLSGVVGYDFHKENVQLDRERYSLDGGVTGAFGPCTPSLTGQYARSQSDLQDVTLLNPENTVETKTLGVALACERAPGLGAFVRATKGWADNSDPLQALSDFETSSMMGGLSYGRPSLGDLEVYAQYQKTDYPNRMPIAGSSNGYELWAGGATYDRRIGARIQGTLTASYNTVEMLDTLDGGDAFDGWAYGASVQYRATSRLNLYLDLNKQISPSIRLGSVYTVQERTSISADYKIGANFVLGVGAERIDETYDGAIPVVGPGIRLAESDTSVFYGSLTFKPQGRYAFKLNVTRQERETNNPVDDYASTRIGLTADVAF